MDKKNKIDVDVSEPAKPDWCKPQAANESNVDSTTSSKHEGPFSSDPFADNYRRVPDLNAPKVLAALRDFPLTPKQLEFVQSAEWAERMRPVDQFHVRLKERGLLEKYDELGFSQSLPFEGRFERLQTLFREEAPDLMGSFMMIWKFLTGCEGPHGGDGMSKM